MTKADHPDYETFLKKSAKILMNHPRRQMSALNGWQFQQLEPEMFHLVREGERAFCLPRSQLYDDLEAACKRWRNSPRAAYFWLKLLAGYYRTSFRLSGMGLFVLPFVWRRLKGPPLEGPPAHFQIGRSSAEAPRASIVVLSFNRLDYLRTTLFSFYETVGDASHELIVVDNGSSDGSREFLQQEHGSGRVQKLLLLDENLGNSGGYNHGFAHADPRSDFLMKLDSDMRLRCRGWLQTAMDFLDDHPGVGFVALYQPNMSFMRLLPSRMVDGIKVNDFGEWPIGSAMLVPRSVYQEVGGFVEQDGMTYAPDDVDYYVRVVRKGYQALHMQDLMVFHQAELVRTRYRDDGRVKRSRASTQLALTLAKQYDRGDRPLEIYLDRYAYPEQPAAGPAVTDGIGS